jgi:hypothetical protein
VIDKVVPFNRGLLTEEFTGKVVLVYRPAGDDSQKILLAVKRDCEPGMKNYYVMPNILRMGQCEDLAKDSQIAFRIGDKLGNDKFERVTSIRLLTP